MKRRFEFRLERVSRVRSLEERVARAERAAAEHLARVAEARAARARDGVADSRAWIRERLRETVHPRAVLRWHRLLDREQHALARAFEAARSTRTQAERAAAAHGERKSRARALEELRARARERHRAELEKSDNALLDEASLRSRGRRAAKRETGSRPGPSVSDARLSGRPQP